MRICLCIIAVLVIVFSLFPTAELKRIPDVRADYIAWEESCMQEYNESSELYIFIDTTKLKLYLFKGRDMIKEYSIAIGTKENPSPVGVFKIVEKGKWGKSYGGRWMGLNVPWGVYGIHGTTKPESIGRAASHGCIRMRNKDVAELYELVGHGTIVEIYAGPFGPFGNGFRELKPGDRGADVIEVQRNLKTKGFYKGSVNGYYSTDMERALNSFQKAYNLPISNIIDVKTYESLGIILAE